jgi:hypothetical protein
MIFSKIPNTKYYASDSPINISLFESDTLNVVDQRINLHIVYDEIPIESIILDSVELPYSKIDFSLPHNFNVGDRVVIYHDDKKYNGDYLVTESVNDDSSFEYYIVVDLIISTPFTLDGAFVGKTIKNSSDQNPASFNISPILKNKVESSIQNTSSIYNGDSNRWAHRLFGGREYNIELNIIDIVFVSGNVGFKIDVPTGDQLDLKKGDEILLDIDDRLWEYTDNFFSSGNLGFSSSNDHYLRENIPIFVNGQITEPYYNGSSRVTSVPTTDSIVTNKSFISSTPVEGGQIVYQAYPEWDSRRVTIQGFSSSAGYIVVETSLSWIQNDSEVRGKITKLGSKLQTINEVTTNTMILFPGSWDYLHYTPERMNEYVLKPISIPLDVKASDNFLSTTRNLPSERDTYSLLPFDGKEHILFHDDESGLSHFRITFLDKDKLEISVLEYQTNLNYESGYFPTCIKDLLLEPNTIVSGSALSVIQDDVCFYEIEALGNPDRAAYFPNDDGTNYRELQTPGTFLMPQDAGNALYTMYMLLDLAQIQGLPTNVYDVFTIDSVTISVSWNSISQSFDRIIYNDDNNTNLNLLIDDTYTQASDGTTYLLYFSRDENSGDVIVGLTNRDYDSFPTVTEKPTQPSYGGKITISPFGLDSRFIGTIYWLSIFDEGDIRDTTSTPNFKDTFGGRISPLSPIFKWFNFQENNTDQQTNLYSWWDFNEGTLYNNNEYAPNSTRYDSMSTEFNLQRLLDIGKWGVPSIINDLVGGDPQIISNKTKYRVDKRCGRFTDPIYLSFIDSLGSLTSIPFKMKNKRYIDADRSSYYKTPVLDTPIKSGGETNYHVKSRRSYEITTDLYTDQIDSNLFIEDLMKSIMVYINRPSDNSLIPCKITTDSLEIEDSDDGVYSYTMEIMEVIDNHRY